MGNTFEANGAVFLPAAGWATSSSQNSGTVGAYWSATQQYPIVFNNTDLQSSYVSLQEVSRFSKFSVRLVYSDGQGGGNESVVTSPIVETGDIIEIGRISAKCGFTILTDDEGNKCYGYTLGRNFKREYRASLDKQMLIL